MLAGFIPCFGPELSLVTHPNYNNLRLTNTYLTQFLSGVAIGHLALESSRGDANK
jgi:hypothetical protein